MKIKVTKPFLDKEHELKSRKIGEELTVTDERADVLISKGFAEACEETLKQEQPEVNPEQTESEKPATKRGRKPKSTD